MENFCRLFTNPESILCGAFLLLTLSGMAQGNCLIHPENSNKRRACELCYEAIEYKQGSKESQLLFDSAIVLNPNSAYAYYQKSVPYFKRGFLEEGIKLLNKAVELAPLEYLTYRATWYFQHESYDYCRRDLERFYGMDGAYLSYTPGGGLELQILLGITYSKLGDNAKAVETVLGAIDDYPSPDFMGIYDYHTLGVLQYFNGDHATARETLKKSIALNAEFADTYYYFALVEEALGNELLAQQLLEESIDRFEGLDGGYTGYPFCFPVSKRMVEEKLKG
jgi:tetratricopeptide (TPR) repeat protein